MSCNQPNDSSASCDEAYDSIHSVTESQKAYDELKMELSLVRKILKMPSFYLANYFIELRAQIDKQISFQLANLEEDEKKKELNKTRTTLIDRIDSFEKKCIKNKLNKEETEAAHERLNSVENQLNDYSNLIQFKTQKKNDIDQLLDAHLDESEIEEIDQELLSDRLDSIEKSIDKIKEIQQAIQNEETFVLKKLFNNKTLAYIVDSNIDSNDQNEYSSNNQIENINGKLLLISDEYVNPKAIMQMATIDWQSTLTNEMIKVILIKRRLSESQENLFLEITIDLKNSELLNLSNNQINAISLNTFVEFYNLKELDMSLNKNIKLEANSFRGLTKLEMLNLSGQSLYDWGDIKNSCVCKLDEKALNGLSNLKTLNLSVNELTELNVNTFQGLTNLEHLNLNQTSLTQIKENTFQCLNKLQTLNLGYNYMSQVNEKMFKGLRNLKILNLYAHHLVELNAKAFFGLTSLEVLDLSGVFCCTSCYTHGYLERINENAFQGLTNLKELDLSVNSLTQLNKNTFTGLNSLVKLNLTYNKINEINVNTFRALDRLKILDLEMNQIMSSNANEFLRDTKRIFKQEIEINISNQAIPNQNYNLNNQSESMKRKMEHMTAFNALKNDIETLKQTFEHPILFLANYFSSLTNEINMEINSRQMNAQLNEIKLKMIEKIRDFERECIRNNEKFEDEEEEDKEVVSIESELMTYLNSLEINDQIDLNEKLAWFKSAVQIQENKTLMQIFQKKTIVFIQDYDNKNELLNGKLLIINDEFINPKAVKQMPKYEWKNTLLTQEFIKLVEIQHRLIQHNNNHILEQNLSLSSLKVLRLNNKGITRIAENAFVGLHSLRELDLSSNHIQRLTSNCFKGLNCLEKLKITAEEPQAEFELEAEAFTDLCNLKVLNLVGNRIGQINANTFLGLENLEELILFRTSLSEINGGTFRFLNSLQRLDLGFNCLTEINQDTFQGLNNLKQLNLSNNNKLRLEANSFRCLRSLEGLYLSGERQNDTADGKLICVSSMNANSFVGLNSLNALNLSFNELTQTDLKNFKSLQSLKILSLGYNEIAELNANAFKSLQNLKQLDLCCNRIRKVNEKAFAGLYNLEVLVLHGYISMERRVLTEINENTFEDLNSLKVLDLSHNALNKLSENVFRGLNNLTELSLNRNRLTKIKSNMFKGLSKLKILNLDENKINKLKANTFQELNCLQVLGLEGNEIEEINENAFQGLDHLQLLNLSRNRLKQINTMLFEEFKSGINLNISRQSFPIHNESENIDTFRC